MPENAAPRTISLLTLAALLIALAAVFLVGLRMNGDPDPSPRGIVASGEFAITAAPDQLEFTATVTNRRATTAEALDATSKGVDAVTDALKKAGVDAEDIQTKNVSVEPHHKYTRDGEQLTGYDSTQSLRIKVRKLDASGEAITRAATAAGNSVRVGSIDMSISNKADLVAQARGKAVEDSKKAATALAKAAGKEVGDLIYVEEKPLTDDIPESPYDQSFSADTASSALKAVPISPGEQKVKVQVKVRWAVS